jgi:transcriptional regulator with XRE-family HTH domain
MLLAEFLKERRKQVNLTQEEFAEKNRSSFNRYIKNRAN